MIFLAIGISVFIGILFLVIGFHGWQNKDKPTLLVSAVVVYMSLEVQIFTKWRERWVWGLSHVLALMETDPVS